MQKKTKLKCKNKLFTKTHSRAKPSAVGIMVSLTLIGSTTHTRYYGTQHNTHTRYYGTQHNHTHTHAPNKQ